MKKSNRKKRPYQVPKRRQPVFTCVKLLLRPFRKKPKIVNLAGELPKRCIVVVNHSAKSGPLGLEMYFPLFCVKWGANEMLGGYRERRAYLRDVFYMRKQGYGRVRAGFIATFEAIFSPLIYKGIKVIGSYTDGRLTETIRKSEQVLAADMAVMIFPENSDDGYFDVMREFFAGFVLLAERHLQHTGEDLPVLPCYYHTKKHIIAIGPPERVGELEAAGLDKKQVAEHFKDRVNALFFEYCNQTT